MKKTRIAALALGALVFGASLILGGCTTVGPKPSKTTGAERSVAASNTMALVENDIRQLVLQIEATNSSLSAILTPGLDNVSVAYTNYAKNVGLMEKSGKVFLERSDKMSAEGKDYFEEWRLQGNAYTNPQIQALSEQRRAELSAVYAQISESSVGVKGSLNDYISKLKEIQAYFSIDLTTKGIEAISLLAQRTIEDGVNLSVPLESVLASIAEVRTELEPRPTP